MKKSQRAVFESLENMLYSIVCITIGQLRTIIRTLMTTEQQSIGVDLSLCVFACLFTARPHCDCSQCRRVVIATAILSVRPSVRLSVRHIPVFGPD